MIGMHIYCFPLYCASTYLFICTNLLREPADVLSAV